MRYSDKLLATKAEYKVRAARQFKRGLITKYEYETIITDAEVPDRLFTLPTTKRLPDDDAVIDDEFLRSWREHLRDIMQEGDEIWYWNTMGGMTGSMGIWVVRGDMVIYEKMVAKA